jgi:hypothetical protein
MFATVAVEAKESKRAHPTLGWIDSSELREFGEGSIIIQSFGDRMPGVRCGNQIILSSRRCVKVFHSPYMFVLLRGLTQLITSQQL